MNVELVKPTSILRLFTRSDGAAPRASQWAPAWAKQVREHINRVLRYRRVLHEQHQLGDCELADLNLAHADIRDLANGLEPLART